MAAEDRRLVAEELGHFTGLPTGAAGYGGFWRRVAAALMDSVVLFVPLMLIESTLLAGNADPATATRWTTWDTLTLLASWLYWAGFHSSAYQATPGKLVMGLRVTDLQGQRISFLRATGRHLAEFLSAVLFLIGYIMVAFTRRKQGLHDLIAGTLVVRKAA
ncbi:putative RDD family membrane protein YckC [Natronocella acetinitrilica]|uniref:RDD family membrane protein YckC n=2 Tax=Natronocella acetinitrilica TaxID=414046 RepID=A0AAE3G514_9GAMM|nr:putative RDD family membrane protein YckC [Natronocella acetinitrilica]